MDTLEISEKLKQAGVAEPQAQAVTNAIQEGVREAEEYADDAMEEAKKELATKADIMRLEKGLTQLRLEMAERDARAMRFSAGLVVAMTGVFSIIVKFL